MTRKSSKNPTAPAEESVAAEVALAAEMSIDDVESCPWETGELGRDESYVAVADPESSRTIDDLMALQMISIRLEKSLLNDLKEIAHYHGIGYQPMIRDLLHRFVRHELKTILNQRLEQIERDEQAQAETRTVPVDDFIVRRRA